MSVLFEMFEGLPRQGPGDEASTLRAYALLDGLPSRPEILDVGCGSGAQTLSLARAGCGNITAVDVHDGFLDELRRRAVAFGDRVHAVNMSMFELDFPDRSFDVIWSEGSIFIMGFDAGIRAWRRLLKDDGHLVASHITWLRADPPAEVKAFWDAAYPAIVDVETNVRTAEAAGYRVIGTFRLPARSWWDELYEPLAPRLAPLREKYADVPETLAEIDETEREIELFRRHSDAYGYVFYVLRKRRD